MRWINGCNAMLKWEKSQKSRKSTKVAYGPHTDIWKINESCTRSYKGYSGYNCIQCGTYCKLMTQLNALI